MARMGYRDSLRWIVENDDILFLDDDDPIPSVTLSLVADQFGKNDEEAIKDLARMKVKIFGGMR